MELYFKSDQNGALSIRHICHILDSKKKTIGQILDSIRELDQYLNKSNIDDGDAEIYDAYKSYYDLLSLQDTYEDEFTTITSMIKKLSMEGNVTPSQDIIFSNLHKANQLLIELVNNYQKKVIKLTYHINEALSISKTFTKAQNKRILEVINDSRDSLLGYFEAMKRLSLIELYNDSKSHRNDKLEELQYSTALSKWISLLKLEPTLKNYIKSKYEFLIQIAIMHIESKIDEGAQYEIDNAKRGFVKDAIHKLYEDYYETLVSQIRQNIQATEDRNVIINQLQNIVQKSLERHIETLAELFDEAFKEQE